MINLYLILFYNLVLFDAMLIKKYVINLEEMNI